MFEIIPLRSWAPPLALFIFCSALFLWSWRNSPLMTSVSTDTHLIACLAAGQADPASFQRDYLLSNRRATKIYSPAYVWGVRQAARWNGDYLSFAKQQYFLILVLFSFGYYTLAYRFSRNVGVSLLFAAALVAPVRLVDPWGVAGLGDSVARNLFAGCVPVVALALLRWRTRPSRWPAVALLGGLLIYVNPVGSVWLSSAIALFLLPSAIRLHRWRAFTLAMLTLGIVQLPYLATYFRVAAGAPNPGLSVVALRGLLYTIYPPEWFHIDLLMRLLVDHLRALPEVSVGVLAALSLGFWRRKSATARLNAAAVAAAILIGCGVPWAQAALSNVDRGVVVEFEIARSLRYLIPFGLLAFVALWRISRGRTLMMRASRVLSIGVLLIWTLDYFPLSDSLRLMKNDWRQRSEQKHYQQLYAQPMLAVQQKTAPGSVIHAPDNLDVRFAAQRPLYFAVKDANLFLLTDWAALREWQRRRQLTTYELPRLSPRAALKTLQHEGVDYWLMKQPVRALAPEYARRTVWSNDAVSLIRCQKGPHE